MSEQSQGNELPELEPWERKAGKILDVCQRCGSFKATTEELEQLFDKGQAGTKATKYAHKHGLHYSMEKTRDSVTQQTVMTHVFRRNPK